MATLSVTYSFVPLTLAESSEVNQNFQDVVTFVNGSVMHRDASSAFTAVPSGPATNPSTDNQLTRKRYVDNDLGILAINSNLALSGASIAVPAVWTTVVARGITASTSGLTIVTAGTYAVGFDVGYGTTVGGSTGTAFGLRLNGALLVGDWCRPDADHAGYGQGLRRTRVLALGVGDVITAQYRQDVVNPLLCAGHMWVEKVRT